MLNSFYPVTSNRTSAALSRTQMLFQMQTATQGIQNLQLQLATGRRVNTISDDITAAIKGMGIQREQEFNTQMLTNLRSSQGFLNVTETNLAQSQELLINARGLAISSIDTTLTSEQRNAIASEIDSTINRLVDNANAKYRDRFLFAGTAISDPPFEIGNTSINFRGNDSRFLTNADAAATVDHTVTAGDAFGVVATEVVGVRDLNPSLQLTSRLEELRGGRGIKLSEISFSNGANLQKLDLSEADSIQDVVAKINTVSLAGRPLLASLTTNGLRVTYADGGGGILRIQEVDGGATAQELGILTTTVAPTAPITGSDLDPPLKLTTRLDQLIGGIGLNLLTNFNINQGGNTYPVKTTGLTTVEDLLQSINNSGAKVQADLTGDGKTITVRSTQSGSDFAISENGGQLATTLGLRTFTRDTPLSKLNYGQGVRQVDGADFFITQKDGNELAIDLNGAQTIGNVLDLINNHPDNQDPVTRVAATLAAVGNGIVLTTPSGGTGLMSVRNAGSSIAGNDLGLIRKGSSSEDSTVNGSIQVIAGSDVSATEVKSVFNTLLRLRDAISTGDIPEIQRTTLLLDDDLERLSLTRGQLGSRQQRIDQLIARSEDKSVELASQGSEALDADLASVISEMTARQSSYEALLQMIGATSRTTLLDYI